MWDAAAARVWGETLLAAKLSTLYTPVQYLALPGPGSPLFTRGCWPRWPSSHLLLLLHLSFSIPPGGRGLSWLHGRQQNFVKNENVKIITAVDNNSIPPAGRDHYEGEWEGPGSTQLGHTLLISETGMWRDGADSRAWYRYRLSVSVVSR